MSGDETQLETQKRQRRNLKALSEEIDAFNGVNPQFRYKLQYLIAAVFGCQSMAGKRIEGTPIDDLAKHLDGCKKCKFVYDTLVAKNLL